MTTTNTSAATSPATQDLLIRTALERGVLTLGDFTLKSGRPSPYFFNFARFDSGQSLRVIADAFAEALMPLEFDLLFGPAYKGIPLVAAVAMALAERGRDVPFAYNRKEAKTHGEGGNMVGAPVRGKVAILDDVLTAGTAIRQAIGMIEQAGATPALVVIAMDRQEAGLNGRSAVQALVDETGMKAIALITARQVSAALAESHPDSSTAIERHLAEFGAQ